MTESVKINLDKALTSLRIISVVAGALIACFFVYANIDNRMDKLEYEQAVFKGVMDERTRNTQDDVKEIKSDVKLLLTNLKLAPEQE